MIDLYNGDCLEVMKSIRDNSIDAIITDPPYGTTACKWDNVIPFEAMWEQLNRIIKPNGAIVLFGSEPFSSALRMSNINNFKYDWIWEKSMPTGMAQNSYMPMKYHEIISVFVNKSKPTFNKQLAERNKTSLLRAKYKIQGSPNKSNHINIGKKEATYYDNTKVNPKTVLKFKSVPNTPKGSKKHPTQKPVLLIEYLIKTYTKENETVLDFTMGSGTTGVACKNLNRNFIGIEKDKNYFEIASKRIKEHQSQLRII
jgi:site-specific DNA-methyltransferase (adenine-specific)